MSSKRLKIRACREADLNEISQLFFDTIRQVNARDYSPAEIEAWAPTAPEAAFWRERFRDGVALVAEENGRIVGFASLRMDGYLDCLFVHSGEQGQGVGYALVNDIERTAKEAGLRCLSADVSVTARTFFERQGFVVIEEKLRELRGQRLKQYSMQKRLGVRDRGS